MSEANLTRFGPETLEPANGEPANCVATVNAIEGAAKLLVQGAGIDTSQIKLNGQTLEQDWSIIRLTVNKWLAISGVA